MKKKFTIEINSTANKALLESFAVIIGKQNEGAIDIDLLTLEGVFRGHCAQFDYPKATVHSHIGIDGNSISFTMDGKTPFITIHQIEVYELETINSNDDLTDVL